MDTPQNDANSQDILGGLEITSTKDIEVQRS